MICMCSSFLDNSEQIDLFTEFILFWQKIYVIGHELYRRLGYKKSNFSNFVSLQVEFK
jgi:hypothetical protein